jgi:glycine/D-amino acid oxidase-like deaminating enzyme
MKRPTLSARAPGYRPVSFWHDSLPEGDPARRPPLVGPTEADVVIVGAGYTGLWAAYYLTELDPGLSIAMVEAEIAGFGASGRNGGWASGEFSMNTARMAVTAGTHGVVAQYRAVWDAIDEIGRVSAAEGIDCHYAKGGSINLATSPPQLERMKHEVTEWRALGFGDEHVRLLDAVETRMRVRSDKAIASVYTPHCASIHPARLARGLAEVVERRGVRIFEGSRATEIGPGLVRTAEGSVKAGTVLRCLEAFNSQMPGTGRWLAPVYSLMIATEPLPEAVWDDIGLAERETFHDGRNLVIYGQRTADNRFAFGGRGAPYHFGSAMKPEFDRDPDTHRSISEALRWLFPAVADARITHTWGGAVGVPRDWTSSVSFDAETRVGRAGGYVGAGVTPSNLAGRTLADLVLGHDTERTRLPWVGHQSPQWEPEPLRFIGINLGRALAPMADEREFRTGRRSQVAGRLLSLLTGH